MIRLLLALLLGALALTADAQADPLTGFTYQGRVEHAGAPFDQPVLARFRLFPGRAGPGQIGPTLEHEITPDADGVFTTVLDFRIPIGPEPRYLQVSLADPDDPATFIDLLPRTPLHPAPLAMHALSAPIPSLGQVSNGRLSAGEAHAFVDVLADGSFDTGLRVGATTGPPVVLSRAGVRASSDFSMTSAAGHLKLEGQRSTLQGQARVDVVSGDSGLLAAANFVELKSAATLVARATALDLIAQGVLEATTPLFRINSPSIFLGNHLFSSANIHLQAPLFVNTSATIGADLIVHGLAAKPGGGLWSALSDARHKKNVAPIPGALDRFNALRPVSFEYKDPEAPHAAHGVFLGFIAQEARAVMPHWVTQTADGTLMLTPQGFEALTVRAIQELDANHHAAVQRLEAENAELRARLDALERALIERASPR